MSDRIAAFQQWLNARGAAPALAVDGQGGPRTRAAVFQVFANRHAKAVTDVEIAALADELHCSVQQIRAVAAVESRGSGWDSTGLLACLWERHYLWKRLRFAVPLLSNPKPGGYTVDVDHDGICDSWEKLADAALLDLPAMSPALAFECASFGKFQIMGGHWKALGYRSALDFAWQLSRSEAAHYRAFGQYIRVNRLTSAMAAVSGNPESCRAIAKGYNGAAYARHGYHERIAVEYRNLGR